MKATPHQSAKRVFGMEGLQTPEMEAAFADVESCLGNIHTQGELTNPKDVRKLAKWVALHAIRCKRHAQLLATLDYRGDVEKLADYFQQHNAIILTWHEKATGQPAPAFITCDNPCLYLNRDSVNFWYVPVSPFRCLCFAPFNGFAESPPWDINKNVLQCATDHCVSFDANLHITDPRVKP